MRIVDAFRPRNTLIVTGPLDEQRQAQHERQRAQHAQGVIARFPEIPRSQLTFTRYWIEADDGRLLREFGGDPGYADNVVAFYTTAEGWPIMLEPADPASRDELEKRQAAKAQRRAAREAEATERRRQWREAAR